MAITFGAPNPDWEQAKIWTPPNGDSWIILLDTWLGVWVHWVGKRTLPCLDDDCPKSRHQRPVRWVGYAPIAYYVPKGPKTAVLPLSPEKAKDLQGEIAEFPSPFLKVHRRDKSREWTIKEITDKQPKEKPPAAPDVEMVLLRVWGINPNEHKAEPEQ